MKKECFKALGFGVIVWLIMFAVVSLFIGLKISGATMTIATTVISAVCAFLFTKLFLKPVEYLSGFKYGVAFVIVGVVLDLLISRLFAPEIFKDPIYWLSYLLIIVVTMFAVKKSTVAIQGEQQ